MLGSLKSPSQYFKVFLNFLKTMINNSVQIDDLPRPELLQHKEIQIIVRYTPGLLIVGYHGTKH